MMRWVVLFLCSASLVWGQSNDRRRFESQVFNEGRQIKAKVELSLWRVGSFHATPIIGLRNLGYDSNVLSTEIEEQQDFTISPEVGLQTYYRINSKLYWENRVTYNYLFYEDQDQLRGSEYGAISRLYGIFKKVYFDLGVDYRRDRTRISSEIDNRVLSNRLLSEFNLVFQPVSRGHVMWTSSLYSLNYDESVLGIDARFNNLERDQSAHSIKYLHKMSPRFWPFVGVKQESFTFDQADNFRDDSESVDTFIGFRNKFDRRMHYNVELGQSSMSFDQAPQLDDDILTMRSLFAYKFSRRTDFRLGMEQFPNFSFEPNYGYYVASRAHVSFGYRVKGRIRVGPFLEMGKNDYQKSVVPVDVLREDDINRALLKITLPMAKILDLDVGIGYVERESNLENRSYDGLEITTEMTYRLSKK